MNEKRTRILKDAPKSPGPVLYWMSRDQRVQDNWALLYAQESAVRQKAPLLVVFCLAPGFLGASLRHYRFMLQGLKNTALELKKKNIPFFLLVGAADKVLPEFVKKQKVSELISDFSPLKIKKQWSMNLASRLPIPFIEVDAHNIVPCWQASPKQEYGAYTLRPKLKKLLPEYLEEFPKLKKHPFPFRPDPPRIVWDRLEGHLAIDHAGPEQVSALPGAKAARKSLRDFLEFRLARYPEGSRDPNLNTLSGLSAYLHFGHISAQRIALETRKAREGEDFQEAFLEELIVRRELADNYCFYNDHYDSFEGYPDWAKKTLTAHRKDTREYIYSREEFERALTHDDLWNAAQREMVVEGKMHSYLRMYWAKKILEWTESPEKAQEICIFLNDRYELDGRDPNGYTGIAWSLGGVHDRAWKERPIFGKIRFMSYKGCASKFDIQAYIKRHSGSESAG